MLMGLAVFSKLQIFSFLLMAALGLSGCQLTLNDSGEDLLSEISSTSSRSTTSSSSGGSTFSGPITSWRFTDSNPGQLNLEWTPNEGGSSPAAIVANSKIYVSWYEWNGTQAKIRVAVYKGDSASPHWNLVDGNTSGGLNPATEAYQSAPGLGTLGTKLYAAWNEDAGGGVYRLRVSVYNGNDSAPSWTSVDPGAATGLNYQATDSAYFSSLIEFNSKLYVTWQENARLRVKVYNGNDAAPSWSFVDGGGAGGGINFGAGGAFAPRFAVFNSKLFATWSESQKIRVAVYNGNDGAPSWTFIDGDPPDANGRNYNPAKAADQPFLMEFNSKLYLTWYEDRAVTGVSQVRIAVWNGNEVNPAWTFVERNPATADGLNYDVTKAARNPTLSVLNAKLYATWFESGVNTNRVAVYNGNDGAPSWTFVDGNTASGLALGSDEMSSFIFNSSLYILRNGVLLAKYNGNDVAPDWTYVLGGSDSPQFQDTGINFRLSKSDQWGQSFAEVNSKLYAMWIEAGVSADNARVAVYNGDPDNPSWVSVTGNGLHGINYDATKNASQSVSLSALSGKLYAAWIEANGVANQLRVAVYNGNDSAPSWTFVDGAPVTANGINLDTTKNVTALKTVIAASKLYITWIEDNAAGPQVRVAVYNGNDGAPSWTFVDSGVNGINYDSTHSVGSSSGIECASKLYVTWHERSLAALDQIRVAVYNGNDGAPSWTKVDGSPVSDLGINKDTNQVASDARLACVNGKLFAVWREDGAMAKQIRVSVYNGNDGAPSWSFIDGGGANGLNYDTNDDAVLPDIITDGEFLYIAWEENGASSQIHVARNLGDGVDSTWTFAEGGSLTGLNFNAAKDAHFPAFGLLGSRIYLGWGEDSIFRVTLGE